VIVDAGAFGKGGAGHSHSDTLSVVARTGESDILIDPGTYTYVGDPRQRDYFRGSAAHNTVRVNGLDQAEPSGPFRWISLPEVSVREWTPGSSADVLEAECRYRGFVHCRRIVFVKSGALLVADAIKGPDGGHEIEQFWHLGSLGDQERFCFSEKAELIKGWRSKTFGQKTPAEVLRVRLWSQLPCRIAAGIALSPGRITVVRENSGFRFTWEPEQAPGSVWTL
jgi:Heparinase II/III-like protein